MSKSDKLDRTLLKQTHVGHSNMRYVSLVCLTLQTTSIIILYSYSRIIPKGATKYLSSTVVVVAEILKLTFCFLVILKDSSKFYRRKTLKQYFLFRQIKN